MFETTQAKKRLILLCQEQKKQLKDKIDSDYRVVLDSRQFKFPLNEASLNDVLEEAKNVYAADAAYGNVVLTAIRNYNTIHKLQDLLDEKKYQEFPAREFFAEVENNEEYLEREFYKNITQQKRYFNLGSDFPVEVKYHSDDVQPKQTLLPSRSGIFSNPNPSSGPSTLVFMKSTSGPFDNRFRPEFISKFKTHDYEYCSNLDGYKKIVGYKIRNTKNKTIYWNSDLGIDFELFQGEDTLYKHNPLGSLVRLLLNDNNVTEKYDRTRCNEPDTSDVIHLRKASLSFYNGLLRTVSLPNINDSLKFIKRKNAADSKTIATFQKEFFTYQLNNIAQLSEWQDAAANKESQNVSQDKKTETDAKNVLLGIRLLILNHSWTLGLFGGTEVRGKSYPRRVADILDLIEKEMKKETTDWTNLTGTISQKLDEAINDKSHHWWNKRAIETDDFYKKAKETLINLAAPRITITPRNK